MQSIPVAMTWELISRGRWSLLAAALGATALPAFTLAALNQSGGMNPADQSMLMISVLMMQFNALMFGAAIISVQGPMSRLYAYPARTSTLVAWRLLPAMVLMAVEVQVSTMALNFMFDVGWSLGGPALFAAVAFAAVEAAIWLTEKSLWTVVALAIVALVLGPWFSARYSDSAFSEAKFMWTEVTSVEFWTMLGCAIAAYGVAIAGVARNRRGESPLSIGFVDWCTRVFEAPGRRARFRSPEHAQFWCEWQRKGWVLPMVVVFGLVVGVTVWSITNREAQDLIDAFVGGGGMLSLVCFLVGLNLGHVGSSDSTSTIGNFRATRPMTTASMANTILYVGAGSVAMAWVTWAAAFLVACWLVGIGSAAGNVKLPDGGYFAATLLGPWIVIGCITSIGLAGRWKLFLQLLCGLAAGIVVLSSVAKYALSQEALMRFQTAILAGAGLGFLLGTVWVYVEAVRRSLVRRATFVGAAVAWVIGATVLVLHLRGMTGEMPLTQYMLPVGILALAVAPLAAAPLALAYNRNR